MRRWLLALAVLLVAAWWTLRWREPGAQLASAETKPVAESQADRWIGNGRAVEVILPPPAAALLTAQPALRRAAQAGSGEAAWRLASSLAACRQAQSVERAVLTVEAAKLRREMEEFLVHADALCAGIDGDLASAYAEAIELGIQAGDPRALLAYLRGPPVDPGLAIRDVEALRRYAQDAPAIARHLLDQGYVDIVPMLAAGYDAQTEVSQARTRHWERQSDVLAGPVPRRAETPLGQALPDHPGLAYRYARLCIRVAPESRHLCEQIAQANARLLDDEEREREQAVVERLAPSMTRTIGDQLSWQLRWTF
jgi:hypothetical protein